MNLAELKAKHPELHAQAVEEGRQEERDRVNGHLIKGQAVGALDIAIKAVQDGTGMSATLDAQYFAAGLSKQNLAEAADDSKETEAATGEVGSATAAEAEAAKQAEAGADLLKGAAASLGYTVEV